MLHLKGETILYPLPKEERVQRYEKFWELRSSPMTEAQRPCRPPPVDPMGSCLTFGRLLKPCVCFCV